MEEENIKIVIAKLKKVFNVKTQKQLAEALGISHAAIDSWKNRKELPNRYKRYLNDIDSKKIDQLQIGHKIIGNGNFVDNNNISFYNNDKKAIENIKRGNITEEDLEILKYFKRLSFKKQEYYFYLIKADVLKDEIDNDFK